MGEGKNKKKKKSIVPQTSFHHPLINFLRLIFKFSIEKEIMKKIEQNLLLVGFVVVDDVDDVLGQNVEIVTAQIFRFPQAAERSFTNA